MARSVIFQLYQTPDGSRKHPEQLHASCDNGTDQSQGRAFRAMLYNTLEETDDVHIVLDGLDECRVREELLRGLPDQIHDVHTSL
ncbi:hypothetical protein K431DRAFT_120631 [Polychaeton citri CBS 116435]|uniref:Nephrocystin 3-like N-terminal domain-containing protein n=1 Tax=Polychaeton citri CBS 116435 TaxID=1314669 RepID=A0A9P4Q1Z2_9PEZI|nr:hypothetical protein K431DRAFT_120631 [Polychaeton citri CBS 116435]